MGELDCETQLRLAGVQYEEGEEIETAWKAELVLWSCFIAAVGAYVSLTTAMYSKSVRSSAWYWVLVVQAGLALGVCCVWCAHFVATLSIRLQSVGNPEVVILFEPTYLALSAVASWLVSTTSLHLILRENSENSHDHEKKASALGMRARLRWYARRLPKARLCASSALASVGMAIMLYTGLLSQAGEFTREFSAGPVLGSLCLAIVAAWVALPVFVTWFDSLVFRVVSALLIGALVNAMHYCGLASATYFAASSSSGVWGPGTEAWRLNSGQVVIGGLVIELVLMAFTGYYVELAREFVKAEESALGKKMAFQDHKNSTFRLIKNSRLMRYPLCLLRYETFAKCGRLVAHEQLRDANKLLYFNTVKDVRRHKNKKNNIVFFSHEWLSSTVPDPTNRHYKDMLSALRGLAQIFKVKLESMHVFVDYSSVPQEGKDQQQLSIESLATYVSLCSAFVIVSPQTVHSSTGGLCNFNTYSSRFWCRLEVLCTVLSSVRAQGELKRRVQEHIVEEESQSECEREDARDPTRRGTAENLELDMNSRQRLFIVVEDALHPLNFFTKDGALHPQYKSLFDVYGGDTSCCAKGHDEDDSMDCDRNRCVDSLTGAYGAMLQDMYRMRRSKDAACLMDGNFKLLEQIVHMRASIFPEAYFGSRIEAVTERLGAGMFGLQGEEHAEDPDRRRGLANDLLANEGSGSDNTPEDSGNDSPSAGFSEGLSGGSADQLTDIVPQEKSLAFFFRELRAEDVCATKCMKVGVAPRKQL